MTLSTARPYKIEADLKMYWSRNPPLTTAVQSIIQTKIRGVCLHILRQLV